MEELTSQAVEILKSLGLGVVPALIVGAWVKWRQDKAIESEKAAIQRELKALESSLNYRLEHAKQALKNSETFFQRQIVACDELYGLVTNMLPKMRHPDMDWAEALEEMAEELPETARKLERFLLAHFTVLPPDVTEKLREAANKADTAHFNSSREQERTADFVYEAMREVSMSLKATVDGQRRVSEPSAWPQATSAGETDSIGA